MKRLFSLMSSFIREIFTAREEAEMKTERALMRIDNAEPAREINPNPDHF